MTDSRVPPQMTTKEANEIVGTLSRTSKMPCHSYNLPATRCITGSKMVKIKGTTCYDCYALKGMYRFKCVKNAMERRYKAIAKAEWVFAMAVLLNSKKSKYFRWHDSGDIQNLEHLKQIFEVCKATPSITHWLPTRESQILAQVKKSDVPENLVIRLSAIKVNGNPPQSWHLTSTVLTENATCPAYKQGGKCNDCRNCWNRDIKNVYYPLH